MPKTMNAVVARLHNVPDLTDGSVRRSLRLSLRRMLAERWWEVGAGDPEALTQAVGRAAWGAGLEALLVPSAARRGGRGLVYFPDHRHPASTLELVNPDQLPDRVP